MYKLFLTLRYLLHRRIAIVPILAVMLCVAMDLIVTSLMGGFLDKVRSAVRGLYGDVIITNGSLSGFGYYDEYTGLDGRQHPGLIQYIDAISVGRRPMTQPDTQPELAKLYKEPAVVKMATPIIETYAVLRLPSKIREGFTSPVRVVGINPEQYAVATNYQDGLYWQRELPGDIDDAARELSATRAPSTHWTGLPSFDHVPGPDGKRLPLSSAKVPVFDKQRQRWVRVPLSQHAGSRDLTGIVVGLRVFWSSPDENGRYTRDALPPGQERVQLTFLPISGKGVVGKEPMMKEFYLVDTAYSHIQAIDSAIAYVPFDKVQTYLGMNASAEGLPVTLVDSKGQPQEKDGREVVGQYWTPARATRVLVKLADGVSLQAGRDAVQRAVDAWSSDRRKQFDQLPADFQAPDIFYEPFRADHAPPTQDEASTQPEPVAVAWRPDRLNDNMEVLVWEQANKEYFSAIANQRFIALLMVGVVSLTVVALIWVIFIMIVVEKTKDIGIIKSVGGSAGGVAWIFLIWAAVIGAIGSALGGLLGWLFIRYINDIELWLSGVISKVTGTPTRLFDPRAYLFDSIPARFQWNEMLWIGAMAVVAAMLGALLPAWRAGRMDPVRSLRYE